MSVNHLMDGDSDGGSAAAGSGPEISGWSLSRKVELAVLAVAVTLLAGCAGVATKSEKAAREGVAEVGRMYRPEDEKPPLPDLRAGASLGDFLEYAMLNDPRIEAAYYDWAASVERITGERSLPDPRLTFQTDIRETVQTVMPGLIQQIPGPGKLRLRADVASAESEARYFEFERRVLVSVFEVKRAYYRLHFLQDQIRVNRETLDLLADLETLARTQNEVGKVTLQDVLRAQIEQDRLATEVENLEDSRQPLTTEFKGSLGLGADQPDPPLPVRFESTPLEVSSEALLETAFALNPRLKALEASVRRAESALSLAYKARVPDFSVGLMVDVKSGPAMFRPLFGMTLPIWRDKIAAEIAQAQTGQRAAAARLTAEEIALSVDLAQSTFAYREVTRNLALLTHRLLPKARQSLGIAQAGYLSGRIDFFNLIDAQQTLLGFELAEVETRTQRELILAELSLVIAGIAPQRAPLLRTPEPASKDNEPKSRE